jgi:hypothetical protein
MGKGRKTNEFAAMTPRGEPRAPAELPTAGARTFATPRRFRDVDCGVFFFSLAPRAIP